MVTIFKRITYLTEKVMFELASLLSFLSDFVLFSNVYWPEFGIPCLFALPAPSCSAHWCINPPKDKDLLPVSYIENTLNVLPVLLVSCFVAFNTTSLSPS